MIESYVKNILEKANFGDDKLREDLYVGSSGIAFMFLKLHQSQSVESLNKSSLHNAKNFIEHAKQNLSKKPEDAASFLCGNAGVLSVSTIIHQHLGDSQTAKQDVSQFLSGVPVCLKKNFNRYGCDEVLFGRAGYLSGIYWLNQNLAKEQRMSSEIVSNIVDAIIQSGSEYSKASKLRIPLMWECYGSRYLGAAHGISSILHMILESGLFDSQDLQNLSPKQMLVKTSIDTFLQMQSPDGNFPSNYDKAGQSEYKLVHWCHGAPGAVYLFAKAYLVFKEQKYLDACLLAGELVWSKGLLRKGPGICHGVGGNGYVFLLLYRLTNEPRHLYRASKFADFLNHRDFLMEATTPDRPLSLFEGVAGTVCFLIDLLQPEKSSFPFMDVFDVKY